ncbi:MAG: 16S rRNA (cytidine(1402)-2'-O)-methyltransferase [Desulfovibrionaceae bacterium]
MSPDPPGALRPGALRPGVLHIVATPIGNPDDCSPRARAVLGAVPLVLAEDTRRAGLLLQRLGVVRTGRLVSLHEHNEAARIPAVLAALAAGEDAALITDAGTPLVSDPGYRLVAACREAGLPVTPVPGPCAAVAALSACGLPPQPFTLLGFGPRRAGQLRGLLARHAATGATLVLYERADRLAATLAAAAQALGPREIRICRELTKTYEEFIPGRLDALDALADRLADLRGEVTLVIGPAALPDAADPGPDAPGGRADEAAVRRLIDEERAAGGKPRQVARRVAARLIGWTADEVYETMRR